jgi:iron-sulfur cluster assembly protein
MILFKELSAHMSTMTPTIETLPVITESAVLTVTPAAAQRIKSLKTEKGLAEDLGLRVFVAGGGCSGMQYGMAFDANPQENDRTINLEGVTLIVDPVSLPYLMGANIDFVDNMMGGGFRIDNPNAVSSCGCGHSFRTSGEAGAEHSHEGGGCSCGGH